MDLSDLDFAGLGTAIAVLAHSNPIYSLATGVFTGIFGKALFDNKKKKRAELTEKTLLLEALRLQKELDNEDTE